MEVIHKGDKGSRSSQGASSFLLTNKFADYLSLTSPSISDYDGYYVQEGEQLFKVLADILPSKEFTSITNNFSWVERSTSCDTETFLVDPNGLLYRHSGKCSVTFTLDCKKTNDDRSQGRTYTVYQEDNVLCVEYTKYTDDSLVCAEYSLVVLFSLHNASSQSFSLMNSWRNMYLPYDARRGMQAERYVYDVCSIRGDADVLICAATTKEAAYKKLQKLQKDMHELHKNRHTQQKNEDDILLSVAHNAFNSLMVQNSAQEQGIYAGLPWFHQFWMRDEAISCIPLLLQKEYFALKSILIRWVNTIAEKNIRANQLLLSNLTADGPGLIAKRLEQFLRQLMQEKSVAKNFSKQELEHIFCVFETYLTELTYTHGLVRSGSKETWMDTIVREGYRVEIQACTIAIYNLQLVLCELLNKPRKQIAHTKEIFIVQVREWLYDLHGKILDGFDTQGLADETVRPNIFLAYYIAPEMFLLEQWEKGFDFALQDLWLSWGGLSSVGMHDVHFHPSHSGVSDESYHNGDSWYFVNNIAAIVLAQIDIHKYTEYVEGILHASTKDLLFQGYIGHLSELSDAKQQRSSGCRAQAWSSATFIELLDVLKR